MDLLTWGGIVVCAVHAAMFSGLNLSLFGLSRLHLQVMARGGDRAAAVILDLRADSHHLLATILWANVGANVLLTLLSESALTGLGAFFFSTIVITLAGEIFPQAYFSRHALRMGVLLAPVIRFYRFLMYPVAKPTAKLLDLWLGRRGIHYFRERDLVTVIRLHAEGETDVGLQEGIGAINFLALDDVPVGSLGEPVDPRSVLPWSAFATTDELVGRVSASGKKWVIFADESGSPRYVMNADKFLRAVLSGEKPDPLRYSHRPILVRDPRAALGTVWSRFEVEPEHVEDHVIDRDVILVWGDARRVITGADLLGRLLHGIARRTGPTPPRSKS